MAAGKPAESVIIKIKVSANTRELDKLQVKLAALAAQAETIDKRFGSMSNSFDDTDSSAKKLTKTIGGVDNEMGKLDASVTKADRKLGRFGGTNDKVAKRLRKFGGVVAGIAKFGLKIFVANLAVASASLLAVNAAFAVGRFAVQAWGAALQVAGVAVASIASALATAAAAQRQYTAAISAYQYKAGGGALTGGYERSSAALRSIQTDATLASFGLQALNATFAAVSANSRFTGRSLASLRGLGDFAVISGDPAKGLAAAGNFIGLLQREGKLTEDVLLAAAEIGPKFVEGLDKAKAAGIDTAEEIMGALANGQLSAMAGLEGQLATVNSTLFAQLKGYVSQTIGLFADIGEPMLPGVQKAMFEMMQIVRRSTALIGGDLQKFTNGTLLDTLVGGFDKMARFTVKLVDEHLPKAIGMIGKIRDVFSKLGDGFTSFVDFIRPLQAGGQVLQDTFGPVLSAIFGGMGNGIQQWNDLLVDNRDDFVGFGNALSELVGAIGRLFGEMKTAIVNLLPAFTSLVNTITDVVNVITGLFGMLNGLGSGGSGAVAALAGGAMFLGGAGGRNSKDGRLSTGASRIGRLRSGMQTMGAGGMMRAGMGLLPMAALGLASGASGVSDAAASWMQIGSAAGFLTGNARLGGGVAGLGAGLTARTGNGGIAASAAGGAALGSQFGWLGALIGGGIGGAAGLASYTLRRPGMESAEANAAADAKLNGNAGAVVRRMQEGNVAGARAQVDAFKKYAAELQELNRTKFQGTVNRVVPTTVGPDPDTGFYPTPGGIAAMGTTVQVSQHSRLERAATAARLLAEGRITENDVKGFVNAPEEYADAVAESAQALDDATRGPLKRFEALTGDIGKMTGMSSDKIQELANSMGVNLYDQTLTLSDALGQLGVAVLKTADEVTAGLNDILASGLSALDQALAVANAPNVIDAAGETMRELGTSATLADYAAYNQTMLTQAMIQNPDRAFAGLEQWSNYTQAGGAQFSTAGGPLYGQNANYIATGGAALQAKAFEATFSQMTTQFATDISASLAASGVVVNPTQLAAELATKSVGELKIMEEKFLTDKNLFAGRNQRGGLSVSPTSAAGVFDKMGINVDTASANNTALDKGAQALTEAASELQGKIMAGIRSGFAGAKPTVNLTVNVSGVPGAKVTTTGASKPAQPTVTADGRIRGGGDTSSSRLSRTLGRHSWLDSNIAGSRTITSAFRNFGLGSQGSDHLTGNAYDLTGQNLVGYRNLVNSSGGFAEFHGGGGNRHLHVVPGATPAGDASSPVRSFSGAPAVSSGVSSSYSFTINATPGMSPQAIANVVMDKLDRRDRSRRERA